MIPRFFRVFSAALVFALSAAGRPHWSGEMVHAHNDVREHVHVEKLTWSDELAKVAQEWAQHLADKNQFVHSRDSRYGENLYAITGARATAKKVVEAWASEERNYDYKTDTCKKSACGHYTQIVWRDSREVGCGVARHGSREVWVCEYSPPGNYTGRRPY